MISLQTYRSLTHDYKLVNVDQTTDAAIVNYDGTHLAVVAKVCLQLSRQGEQYRVQCRVVSGKRFRSIFGR